MIWTFLGEATDKNLNASIVNRHGHNFNTIFQYTSIITQRVNIVAFFPAAVPSSSSNSGGSALEQYFFNISFYYFNFSHRIDEESTWCLHFFSRPPQQLASLRAREQKLETRLENLTAKRAFDDRSLSDCSLLLPHYLYFTYQLSPSYHHREFDQISIGKFTDFWGKPERGQMLFCRERPCPEEDYITWWKTSRESRVLYTHAYNVVHICGTVSCWPHADLNICMCSFDFSRPIFDVLRRAKQLQNRCRKIRVVTSNFHCIVQGAFI